MKFTMKLLSMILVLAMLLTMTAMAAEPETATCEEGCVHTHEEDAAAPAARAWECSSHNIRIYNETRIKRVTVDGHVTCVVAIEECTNSGCSYKMEYPGPNIPGEIEPAEYEAGSKVCLISASYAEANGLSVGDTLTLDYYDTGYFLHTGEQEMVTRTVYEMTMTHNPLQESNRIGYEAEYEIVGIYTAPEWEFGAQTFHADTIFVPKASVPNSEEYEDPALPLLNSIVIQNGSEEEFEAYMESQGYGGYYEFYDHDYSSNIAGFEAMALNAQRLLILGLIVLAVTCILFYYLNFRRMIPVARNMRRLGHSRFGVWLKILTTTLPLFLISVLAGGFLGAYSFDYMTNELLSTEIFLDLNTVKQITLTAAAALCIPPMLIAVPISLPRLMKRK